MQRFWFFIVCMMCASAANSAYLPVVDVSRGGVSARAAFGEDIVPVVQLRSQKSASESQKSAKKVVARGAKKTVGNNVAVNSDVLRPNRPRSDLWARNGEEPLRMPRMDEIAVLDSDVVLPEESLDGAPSRVAQVDSTPVSRDEALRELKQLRAEIAKLSEIQQKSVATARPLTVRTPIVSESNVQPIVKPVAKNDGINVQREIVPMETSKNVTARVAAATMAEPTFTSVKEMTKMSPNELKKAFKKTYLSENKHLSTYENDSRYDTISEMTSYTEGFSATRDLSETEGGVRPLEIKISFMNGDSGLSRDNYNLLSETASIVVNNPKRAIQIAIPESVTHDKDSRKLAARRLAIVEQVLRDTGISDQRIVPVLSQRSDDAFVLRIISGDVYESLTQQKRNMFGDDVSKKTYKNMSW